MNTFLIIAKFLIIYIAIGVAFSIVVELIDSSESDEEVAMEIWLWPIMLPVVVIMLIGMGTVWIVSLVRDLVHKSG